MGKRESWLLCLVCLPGVSWLLCGYSSQCYGFVCSLWLWYSLFLGVIFMRTAVALATFAWSSLSLRRSLKFSCGDSNGDWLPFCVSSNGSGESAHLHRLTWAFVTVQNLLCCLKWRFVCYSRQQWILWWVCTFGQAVTGQCNKYQELLCWQQRLLGVCTFAQARLSLLYSIEISCAGWNGIFCNVYVNSEWCGESAPATTGNLCNHQCVVSMRQKMHPVRCYKNSLIKHLLVYQEKKKSSNRFLDVISWEYDNSCA